MSLSPSTTDTPRGELYICKSVPFDRGYNATILFNSYESQRAFIESRTKYHTTEMSPITLGDPIKVPYPADQLYECNYIYFQSQNSNKWFPAFITEIKRINQSVAEIYYEMDVLQSWMLEWVIKPCMVLREHVTDDTPGSNIQPEPIDIGDYVINKSTITQKFSKRCVIVATSDIPDGPDGVLKGGIAQCVKFYKFDVEGKSVGGIVDLLQTYSETPDKILSIFMYPTDFYDTKSEGDTSAIPTLVYDATNPVHYTDIDGYKCRNFKLYTYPYNMIYVTDRKGNAASYRYEFFSGSKYKFGLACAIAPTAQAIIFPMDYAGVESNLDEKLAMPPFPQGSWASDTYRAYVAQNSANIVSSIAGSALTIATGLATKNVGAVVGGVAGLGNTLQEMRNHSIQPPQAQGNVAADTVFGLGSTFNDFLICQKCITKDYAQAIDSFFDVYGYAVNKIKVPNLTGRPSWNYVKTENITITGEIAFADISKLEEIFNNGVTFWHGDYVGDYSRSNK